MKRTTFGLIAALGLALAFVKTAGRRDIGLTADDGLDAVFDGGLIKINGPEDIAVVGHGQRRHFIFSGFLD